MTDVPAGTPSPQAPPTTNAPAPQPIDPLTLIPEKHRRDTLEASVAELAKAYKSAEDRLHSKRPLDAPIDVAPTNGPTQITATSFLDMVRQEADQHGAVKPETIGAAFTKLSAKDAAEVINTALNSRQLDKIAAQIEQRVGGPENVQKVAEWARTSGKYTPSQLAQIQQAMNNPALFETTFMGLHARYTAEAAASQAQSQPATPTLMGKPSGGTGAAFDNLDDFDAANARVISGQALPDDLRRVQATLPNLLRLRTRRTA